MVYTKTFTVLTSEYNQYMLITDQIEKIVAESGVTEDEVRKVVADKGHYAESMPVSEYPAKFISGWLIKYWPQIVEIIDKGRSARD